MKLIYNVLCIDDKIDTLKTIKTNLSTFNDNVGIETKYTDIPVVPGALEAPDAFWSRILIEIEDKFSKNIYDLILVDLHMPLDVSGADIIHSIRKSHTIYRPIIFYSAGDPKTDDKAIEQLNIAVSDSGLLGKGVLITSRSDLNNQAKTIFAEMHKEEHKINRVRGLLMDRVSELDASVVELVQNDKLWELVPDGAAKNKIVTEFKQYLQKDCSDAEDLLAHIKTLDIRAIQAFLKSNTKDVSTYRKGYLLRAILKQIEDLKPFAEVLKEGIDGDESLRGLRNQYGHTIARKLNTDDFDRKCVHIRKESRRQLNNIDDIRKKL